MAVGDKATRAQKCKGFNRKECRGRRDFDCQNQNASLLEKIPTLPTISGDELLL